MKVLLDECLPLKVKRELAGHDASTVPEMGWSGKTNGELLRLAQDVFDVFITVDQGLEYQQNLIGTNVAVITLVVANNRFESFLPLLPKLQKVLSTIRAGEFVRIGA